MIPFARTVCACPVDVANCKTRPGFLLREDITRIGEVMAAGGDLGHAEEILTLLRASKGALVFSQERGMFRIGTITPQLRDGRCVFLDEADRCRIHEIAPFGCAYFDAHMPKEEGDRRSSWGLHQILNDRLYETVREVLVRLHGEQDPFEKGL